jgi:hypothetical protein
MDYYRVTRQGIVWGCSIHKTPRGIECQGCDDQTELFSRADVTAPMTPTMSIPPCSGCGLYDDEHCPGCLRCPDDHDLGCTLAPVLANV